MSRHIPAKIKRTVTRRAKLNAPTAPCQVMSPAHDPYTWVEYHHRRMFSRGGRHTSANLVVVCDECHKYIHSNVRWSIQRGLLMIAHPRRYWRPHEWEIEENDRLQEAQNEERMR